MNVKYKIEIPRKTYDGLCAYMQQWGDVYRQPGAVVFRGMLRKQKYLNASAVASDVTAQELCLRFTNTLHGLGRAKVRKNDAVLDLRDLSEEEVRDMVYVAAVAKLKAQQSACLVRIASELRLFQKLPDMVRIALAAL